MNEISSRRESRVRELKLAIRRLETGRVRKVPSGTRLSISAVAREAGIDPATIHTAYPDIAELIRKMMGRETRAQRDSKASELREARRQMGDLRAEVAALKQELTALASRHATLLIEAQQLRASLPATVQRLVGASRSL